MSVLERGQRLSVMPVNKEHFERVVGWGSNIAFYLPILPKYVLYTVHMSKGPKIPQE